MSRSPLTKRALARLQHAWLAVLRRTGWRTDRLALFHPRAEVRLAEAIPSGDYKEIFVYECYRPALELPQNPRILDLGSHLGLSVLYFLDRYPGCSITAFEPNPAAFALLSETLGHGSWGDRLQLLAKAASHRDGRCTLYVDRSSRAPVNASLTGRDTRGREVEAVDVERIDIRQFLGQTVDHMKMDIEGHEYDLLVLPEIRPDRVRSICVELHDVHERIAPLRRVLEALVKTRGYRLADQRGLALEAEELCRRRGSVVVKFYAAPPAPGA